MGRGVERMDVHEQAYEFYNIPSSPLFLTWLASSIKVGRIRLSYLLVFYGSMN